jgi:hypothetical protein
VAKSKRMRLRMYYFRDTRKRRNRTIYEDSSDRCVKWIVRGHRVNRRHLSFINSSGAFGNVRKILLISASQPLALAMRILVVSEVTIMKKKIIAILEAGVMALVITAAAGCFVGHGWDGGWHGGSGGSYHGDHR